MNKKHSNKLNSYQSVKGVLENNQNIYQPIDIINRSVDNFFEVVEQIVVIATQVELDTTGETSAKIEAKQKLANMASGLAATGAVYAFEREDVELEASLSYSFTDIRYSKDAETLEIARAIESVLLENQSELEPYMVSEQNLVDLHSLIEEFERSMKIRGGVKSTNVAETRRLALLFRVADDLLNKRLDRFIARLKAEYPTFYDAYTNARMIVDL